MITTRDIDVDLNRGKRPLNQKTTKEVDVHVKTGTPKPTKIAVSTHNIEDVADIAEKKRRDEIIAGRQVIITEQKAAEIIFAEAEQGKTKEKKVISVYPNDKGEMVIWKKLTADEKKRAMKARMAKVQAAKEKKNER